MVNRGFLPLVAALVLTGCTYTGSDNPVARKTSWFSYLNGDDLRPLCVSGAPDRYRLVYNAVYQEQVRAYDVVETPGASDAARLTARVTTASDMAKVSGPDGIDPFGPWRAKKSETRLRASDFEQLGRALVSDGLTAPGPTGLELDSDGFYWVAGGCMDGTWHYSAWSWPSKRFEALAFDDLLFAWDFTEVPVGPPRKTTKLELYGSATPSPAYDRSFRIRVEENGLWGAAPLF